MPAGSQTEPSDHNASTITNVYSDADTGIVASDDVGPNDGLVTPQQRITTPSGNEDNTIVAEDGSGLTYSSHVALQNGLEVLMMPIAASFDLDGPTRPVYGPDGVYGPVTPNERLQILYHEAGYMLDHIPIPQDGILDELNEM
jgi:hypothetical protein